MLFVDDDQADVAALERKQARAGSHGIMPTLGTRKSVARRR